MLYYRKTKNNGWFDWGSRTRCAGTAGEKGAGLALLFCHDFVERLGGSISVESNPGEGTAMTVIVPDGAVQPQPQSPP